MGMTPAALRRFALLALFIPPALASADSTAQLTVRADQPGAVINRNIYGQFSEHLGHCIYDGIWVGPDSPSRTPRGTATPFSRR
jgi:alpha-N-arabinofuranosidase